MEKTSTRILVRCGIMQRSFWVIALVLLHVITYAQSKTVTGNVQDEAGSGLPGVNILVKGTNNGTTSDAEGNFNISMPGTDAVLIFSFIGFQTQEVSVGSQTMIRITMRPDVVALNEVV